MGKNDFINAYKQIFILLIIKTFVSMSIFMHLLPSLRHRTMYFLCTFGAR